MNKKEMGKNILVAIIAMQLLVLNAAMFYFGGVKRFGTPGDYFSQRKELLQAKTDSLRLAGLDMVEPENAGDSTLYGLGDPARLFERIETGEARIAYLQAMIDSLEREKITLENIRTAITRKEEFLKSVQEQARSQNLGGLAKMFDIMDVKEAVPVIIELDDSLAVNILLRVKGRKSAALLGALAKADTSKAVRLSRLLATIGTLEGQ